MEALIRKRYINVISLDEPYKDFRNQLAILIETKSKGENVDAIRIYSEPRFEAPVFKEKELLLKDFIFNINDSSCKNYKDYLDKYIIYYARVDDDIYFLYYCNNTPDIEKVCIELLEA